jgi:hypothetical protein
MIYKVILLTVRAPSIAIIYNNEFSPSPKLHRQIKKRTRQQKKENKSCLFT